MNSFSVQLGLCLCHLDTLSIFGMFNDASVKDDVMVLASKIETSFLRNRRKQANMKHYFAPL